MLSCVCKTGLSLYADPLYLIRRRVDKRPSSSHSTDGADTGSAKLMRERSIKTNRRQRFIDCLTQEDVSMGMPFENFWRKSTFYYLPFL